MVTRPRPGGARYRGETPDPACAYPSAGRLHQSPSPCAEAFATPCLPPVAVGANEMIEKDQTAARPRLCPLTGGIRAELAEPPLSSKQRRVACRRGRACATPRRQSSAAGRPGRLQKRPSDQQREQPRRARSSASVPSKPTVQHVGQPRHAIAVTGRSASETGPTTAARTIVSTAAIRPSVPLKRCTRTEPLASGERRV